MHQTEPGVGSMRLKVVPVGRELLEISPLPGDPLVERALDILRKVPRSFFSDRFPSEVPLIVFDLETGRNIGGIMQDTVLRDRSSESSITDLKRGLSTYSDLLVYLMDASLNASLNEELERIYSWLLLKHGMLSGKLGEQIQLDARLTGLLNYLRRRTLSHQLISMEGELSHL